MGQVADWCFRRRIAELQLAGAVIQVSKCFSSPSLSMLLSFVVWGDSLQELIFSFPQGVTYGESIRCLQNDIK